MTPLDAAVLGAFALLMIAVGTATRGRGKSVAELHLAGRSLPTWAVLCSMVATEVSAATFLGVPHAAYTGNWTFLQFALGSLLAKGVLAAFVIPLYHRMGVVTVYGFLGQRFDATTQRVASFSFIVGRLFASGARLFIAALAFSAATTVSVELAIIACGGIAVLYTRAGGIRSVVWTDTLQAGLFVVGGGIVLVFLVQGVDGGLPEIHHWATQGHRTRIFSGGPLFALDSSRALGVAVLGGFFLTLATHATDHDMVQRLLCARSGSAGGRALWLSAWINFPVTLLFLCVGTALAAFYAAPPAYDITDGERIVALFALHELPSGLRGLVFAGLFAAALSSLDSAICAIATTWVVDVAPRQSGDEVDARRTRRTILWTSLLLTGTALCIGSYYRALSQGDSAAAGGFNLLDLALSSMTILYGGLLGVFAVALLSPGSAPRSGVAGIAVGSLLGLLLFLHPIALGETLIAWPWWLPASSLLALGVTLLATRRDLPA